MLPGCVTGGYSWRASHCSLFPGLLIDHSTSPHNPTPVIYLSDHLKKGITQFPLSYLLDFCPRLPVFMDVLVGSGVGRAVDTYDMEAMQ